MNLDQARAAEIAKYSVQYQSNNYGMGDARKRAAQLELGELRGCHSLLDVGCGRGEVLTMAETLGMEARGVEVVEGLIHPPRIVAGLAWDLPFPDQSFDVVTMFDVMEHLLAEDSERVCRELARVASKHVLLTVANFSHRLDGVELHITRRPYQDWDADFRRWFSGTVEWRPNRDSISETWLVTLS